MIPLINYTIPQRNYEIIRDRIGFILELELTNQYQNYNPDASIDGVFCERLNPIDKTEMAAINVSVISGNWDNKHQGGKDGTMQYAVDIYTNCKSGPNKPGDSFAQFKMQRLAGICDYILEDPQYKTLGFAPGPIKGFEVSELQIKATDPDDSANSSMGRLVITLRVFEPNKLLPGNLFLGNTTSFSLFPTGNGYQYILS